MEPRFLPTESAMGHSGNMKSKTQVSLSLGILCRRAMENSLVPRSNPKLEINETRIGEKEEEQVGTKWGSVDQKSGRELRRNSASNQGLV